MRSLRAKLMLAFAALAVFIIVIMLATTFITSARVVESNAHDLLGAAVDEQMNILHNRLNTLQSQIELLARANELHTGTDAEKTRLLDQVHDIVPGGDTVFLAGTNGLSRINSSRATLNLVGREYFTRAMAGESSVQVVVSLATRRPVLVAAAPIVDSAGEVTGMVGIYVDLANDPTFAFSTLTNSSDRYIVSRDGYFLTPSRLRDNAVLNVKTSDVVLERFAAGADEFYFGRYTDDRGREVYGAHLYYAPTDWVLVAEVDIAELFAQVYQATWSLAVLGLIALALSFVASYFVARGITKDLAPVTRGAKTMAAADLSFEFETSKSKDEIGQLSQAFGQMLGDLKNIIGHMQEASVTLVEMADEIGSSTGEVAEGNQSQASIAQEISRTVEQLAAVTQEIAANAQNAAAASSDSRDAAEQGVARVEESIVSLQSVQESVSELARVSERIGSIVVVIEEIASQTELLALNAAIEAARAGEHGRGFAVVADAVRDLSEQSRQSTSEISQLIRSIQKRINEAVDVSNAGAVGARSAQEALASILKQANNIALMVEGISAASQEQAASANEVAASMENLGAISEQVSASSQETAAAGASLQELGKLLQESARKFKL